MRIQRSHTTEYDRDETGRITKVARHPFNLDRAKTMWRLREPDPIYRRFVLEEIRKDAEARGHLYTAQSAGDLLAVL